MHTYGTEPVTISLSNLTVIDADSTYPDDFSLSVQDGSNYSRSETTITPDQGFTGNLTIPVSVNDGGSDSNTYDLNVYVGTLISVTTSADDGPGSLRQAIVDGHGGI